MQKPLLSAILLVFVLLSCKPQHEPVTTEKKPKAQPQDTVVSHTIDTFGIKIDSMVVDEHEVKPNESLYILLDKFGFSDAEIYSTIQEARPIMDVKGLKPGQKYRTYALADSGSAISHLVWQPNPVNYVVFNWSRDSLEIYKAAQPLSSETAVASGAINSSLYNAISAGGGSPLLGYKLANIFAWQVDFFSLREGDAFNALYEKRFINGDFFGIGEILAAEFIHRGEPHRAYRFSRGEVDGYFTENGESVQKALLKAPFQFNQRISSHYNRNRLHPILNVRRPHTGVDYAAPYGTPVLAVGDGVVTEAQYRGANGNIVQIEHNSTYETAYLHLSDFASGIRPGATVEQGQVIAYVGNTGRSTGTHLHYMLYKNGSPVNPLTVDLPSSESIPDSLMGAFKKVKKSLDKQWQAMDAPEVENPAVITQNRN